jgi:hypothetical protein
MACLPLFADIHAGEGFAFYLIDGQQDNGRQIGSISLDAIHLHKLPLIGASDIISYSESKHSIHLTSKAFVRATRARVGDIFAACVDKKPIYLGRMWSDILSSSSNDVLLVHCFMENAPNCMFLQLGYPNQSYFVGRDPRSDDLIMKTLRNAGKLEAQ